MRTLHDTTPACKISSDTRFHGLPLASKGCQGLVVLPHINTPLTTVIVTLSTQAFTSAAAALDKCGKAASNSSIEKISYIIIQISTCGTCNDMTTSKAGSIVSACQQNILSRFQQPNPESFANPHLHTCGHCGIATHRAALGALGNNRTFWVGLLDLQSKSVHAPPPPSLFLWLTWTQMGLPEGCRLGHR